jgi:phage gp46-like protein
MDFKTDTTNGLGYMTFGKNTDIRTDIYLSLSINQGDFFQNSGFGSQLFRIKKVTPNNIVLAQKYVTDALNWLIQTGRASSITVIVEKDTRNIDQLDIKVTALQPNGVTVYYQQFNDVRSGKITWTPVGGPAPTWIPV